MKPLLCLLLAASLIASSRTEERAAYFEVNDGHLSELSHAVLDDRSAALLGNRLGRDGPSIPATAVRLSGWATYYDVAAGHAAAGPLLRSGDWRGRTVQVCAKACVIVRLTDWCACGSRHGVPTLIDLARADFARLAPTSQGVVRVTVSGAPALPNTDTEMP